MYYKLLIYQKTSIENITEYLQANGFVIINSDDSDIESKIEAKNYDICILDCKDEADRYSLIRKVRAISKNVVIFFMTKSFAKDDAVNSFKAGADDYIHTPYDIRELICRMNAVLERSGKSSLGSSHVIGKYVFNNETRELTYDDTEVSVLTDKEAKLLNLLCEYKNSIMPRSVALKSIWHDDNVFNGRSMDVYIVKLRKLLAKDEHISIVGIRSQGFALVAK